MIESGWIDITDVFVDEIGHNYYILHPDQSPEQNIQIVKINIKVGLKVFVLYILSK